MLGSGNCQLQEEKMIRQRLKPAKWRVFSDQRTLYIRRKIEDTSTGQSKVPIPERPFPECSSQSARPVSIYLVNGIKLLGTVEAFDRYVAMLKNDTTQMVYKHSISTIVPGRPIQYATQASDQSRA